ncbi:endonuclease/exonuclease/phosphatase family protein [bacterium]|nr:endonuclease/exonuclease/phosphatase family protein [bacterium]
MQVKLITLNVRYDNPRDGANIWARRRSLIQDFLRSQEADWLAFQEVLPAQRKDLETMLPGYRSYGISRDGQGKDEQCCWFVREPWWFEEARTIWLSQTPDQPSQGWDAMLPRVVSLVKLASGQQRCWAANLHLDHHGPEARRQGLRQVVELLDLQLPGVVLGDFNQEPGIAGWVDCQQQSSQANLGTFHDFQGGTSGPRIDGVLLSPHWTLQKFQMVEDARLSDHYPLVVEGAIGA